jgi:hypothetical protein
VKAWIARIVSWLAFRLSGEVIPPEDWQSGLRLYTTDEDLPSERPVSP